jgi:hypothetical protein
MTTITLAAIEAEHQKVAGMIATFKAQAPRIITIDQTRVELHQGEHYAGMILAEDGLPSYHLILLPGTAEKVTWDEAKTFAEEMGGELPTRREQALLFSNLKSQFEESAYWSSEQHAADVNYAWFQYFDYGDQFYDVKSASLRARAVRRLTIQ